MTVECANPPEPGARCFRCDPCAASVLQRASQSLSEAYGRPVELSLQGRRVVASPEGLQPLPPPRERGPEAEAWVRSLAAEGGADAVVAALREHKEQSGRRLAAELCRRAAELGAGVSQGSGGSWHHLRLKLPSGARLRVRIREAAYAVGRRSQSLSGLEALEAAVVAEMALDGRLSAESRSHPLLTALLAGEPRRLEPWQTGLVERMGLMDDDPHAAWLRAELGRYLEHGPTPGGLGSPVALGGVTYAGGRLLRIDGVPLCHVDVDALAAWRLWASQRAARRRHPVVGHPLALGWIPAAWGPPGDPACAQLPFARDGPEPARVHFDRHRRMYAREALPPVNRRRPPTDWGRAGTPLPLDPPRRSRGRARALYAPIVRHWLVGWSLSELAAAAGVPRGAVDRLIRSAKTTSAAARRAFELNQGGSYAGQWLAVRDGLVVVTETWRGDDDEAG